MKRVFRQSDEFRRWLRMAEVSYLDYSEKGLTDIFEVKDLLPAMRRHADMEPTVHVWLTVELFGEKRMAVGSLLPRMVQTYWEEEQRRHCIIPQQIRACMDERAERLVRGRRVAWEQQGLHYQGLEGEESWVCEGHHTRQRGPTLDPTTCVLHMEGQQKQVTSFPTSTEEGLPIMGEL